MALCSYGAIDEGNACASRSTFRETQLKGGIENVYLSDDSSLEIAPDLILRSVPGR
jgi:hypothetical protein